tara:strand:- start:434 stop:820 length:387 start_codon:yes stop_codon:yes gene_type:complete
MKKRNYGVEIDSHKKEIELLKEKIRALRGDIGRAEKTLQKHIGRQTAEIRVLERDDSWGDYTGIFSVDKEDAREIVIGKAKAHFKKYFKNGIWYKDHTFGIFLNRSGKKELQEKIEINREKSDVKNNR